MALMFTLLAETNKLKIFQVVSNCFISKHLVHLLMRKMLFEIDYSILELLFVFFFVVGKIVLGSAKLRLQLQYLYLGC